MLVGSVFAQSSDCPPCKKDQPASPGKACCGTEEYDPETHECCGNKVVEKGKCCRKGGTPAEYDKETECCESAGVLQKNPISNLDNCPNMVPNPRHTPSSNGCGIPPFVSDGYTMYCNNTYRADFGPYCDAHDICYDTCKSDRITCDTNFYSGMRSVCETFRSYARSHVGQCPNWPTEYVDCEDDRSYFKSFVVNAGKSAWKSSQKKACNCCN